MKSTFYVFVALMISVFLPATASGRSDERIERIRWKAGESAATVVINGVPGAVVRNGSGWLNLAAFEKPGDNVLQVIPIDSKVQGQIEVIVESIFKDESDPREIGKITLDEKSDPQAQGKIEFQSEVQTNVYSGLTAIDSFSPEDEKAVRELASRLIQAHQDRKTADILKLYQFSLDHEANISKRSKAQVTESNQKMLEDMFKSFPKVDAKKPEDLRVQHFANGIIIFSMDRIPDNWILNRTNPSVPGAAFPIDQLMIGKIAGKWMIVSLLEY